MRQLNLRAATTFFNNNNKKTDTWILHATKKGYQLDHMLVPKQQLHRIMEAKRKMDGIPSNHAAVMIKIKFPERHRLIPNKKREEIE